MKAAAGIRPPFAGDRGVLVAGVDPVLSTALARGGLPVVAEVRQAELLFASIQEKRPGAVVISFPLDGAYEVDAVLANLAWLFPELPVFIVGWPEASLPDEVRLPASRLFPSPPDYRQLVAAVSQSLASDWKGAPSAEEIREKDGQGASLVRETRTAGQVRWPEARNLDTACAWPPWLQGAPGPRGVCTTAPSSSVDCGYRWPAAPSPASAQVDNWPPTPAVETPSLVITVCSPKGGVGKTFLAVNLAAAICVRARVNVVLLDWDLTSPDVGIHLGLHSGPTLLDLVNRGQDVGTDGFRQYLVPHRASGLQVLRGPARPELAEFITQEHLRTVLLRARASFPVVVVDTSPSPCDEAVCQAIEAAGRIVLVVGQDAACLYQARIFLDLMPRLGVRREAVWVVANRYQEGPPDVREIQRFLGTAVAAVLPDDPSRTSRAIMEGHPLVLSPQPGRLGEAVLELAQRIYPTFQLEPRPRRTGRWRPPWRRTAR